MQKQLEKRCINIAAYPIKTTNRIMRYAAKQSTAYQTVLVGGGIMFFFMAAAASAAIVFCLLVGNIVFWYAKNGFQRKFASKTYKPTYSIKNAHVGRFLKQTCILDSLY